jgi:hypothetical protein
VKRVFFAPVFLGATFVGLGIEVSLSGCAMRRMRTVSTQTSESRDKYNVRRRDTLIPVRAGLPKLRNE